MCYFNEKDNISDNSLFIILLFQYQAYPWLFETTKSFGRDEIPNDDLFCAIGHASREEDAKPGTWM